MALADLWNRGVLDVVVANQKGPLLVYKNIGCARERLDRISVGRNAQQSQRDRRAGHACSGMARSRCRKFPAAAGFAAQNDRRLHFGLGKNPKMEKAVIRWPSGKVQTIDQPAVHQLHKIKEPA